MINKTLERGGWTHLPGWALNMITRVLAREKQSQTGYRREGVVVRRQVSALEGRARSQACRRQPELEEVRTRLVL